MPDPVAKHMSSESDGLRERKKRKLRQKLADVSLELFAEKGYDNTTIADIVECADVSPRTFFRFFSSKEDLLFNIPDRDRPAITLSASEFRIALENALRNDVEAGDLALVHAAFQSLVPMIQAGRERMALVFRAAANSSVVRGRIAAAGDELGRRIAAFLAKRRGAAHPNDVDFLTGAISMTIYAQAAQRWSNGTSDVNFSDILRDEFENLDALVNSGSHRSHPYQWR